MTVIRPVGGYVGTKPTWDFNQRTGVWTAADQYQLQKQFGWPLAMGSAVGGGYFAGYITYGVEAGLATSGNKYVLIMAPKALGEAGTILRQSTGGSLPVNSQWDGYYLTYNYGSSTSYPAANYCYNLNFNGYSDWYLPSRREAEVVFGNLRLLAPWQTGGSEAFTSGTVVINGSPISSYSIYWASTTSNHYRADAGFGVAGYPVTDQFFVRAIRRIPYPQ